MGVAHAHGRLVNVEARMFQIAIMELVHHVIVHLFCISDRLYDTSDDFIFRENKWGDAPRHSFQDEVSPQIAVVSSLPRLHDLP